MTCYVHSLMDLTKIYMFGLDKYFKNKIMKIIKNNILLILILLIRIFLIKRHQGNTLSVVDLVHLYTAICWTLVPWKWPHSRGRSHPPS